MLRLLLLSAVPAFAVELPVGQIVDKVTCVADPAQSYALYLPSKYSHQLEWPVIFAFDPRARGRVPVERYQAAAEKYGYIVAGSNNSRNGSWTGSLAAAQAMMTDVGSRFAVDTKRVYTAGMSGGARVAVGVALGANIVAGVVASSAGFPDSKPRKTVPFVVFGTAGTEDFNYLEMRQLDRALTSPHYLAIFEGGHTWLSSDLATEAVEWLEIQAMKSGRRPRDQARIDEFFTRRTAAASAQSADPRTLAALSSIAADFEGLKDTSEVAARAEALRRDKRVRDALKKERRDEEEEHRQINEILILENALLNYEQRSTGLAQLRDRWKRLDAAAHAPEDTPERRMSRRISSGLVSFAQERVRDPEYLSILATYRRPSR